ncbi:hypothetical protein PV08_05213 [Exophiala spinifera]|uniref:BZIP domain-containing protein n=1 Tax=Exophiala spinifera TaxID=91928 RepID=A0A0D2B8C2_9EURO|nr:uncharacterized protein PV08_05213 [Exophiala spinifera]KIW15168.1 hypothetical protein PV08_05213 [Exophiala spinifera]
MAPRKGQSENQSQRQSKSQSQSKRKADALNVPQPGQDAAERKRVLNVLAQRRYRQRRKEHFEKLEAQVSGAPLAAAAAEEGEERPSWIGGGGIMCYNGTQSQSHEPLQLTTRNDPNATVINKGSMDPFDSSLIINNSKRAINVDIEICDDNELDFAATFLPPDIELGHGALGESQIFTIDNGGDDGNRAEEEESQAKQGEGHRRGANGTEDLFAAFDEQQQHHNHNQHLLVADNQYFLMSSPMMLPSLVSPSDSDTTTTQSSSIIENPTSWCAGLLPPPSPRQAVDTDYSTHADAEDFQFPPPGLLPMSTAPVGGADPVPRTNTNYNHNRRYTFPDEMHIQVAELDLLRGCMSIAQRLQIQDMIWSLTSLSPFADSASASADEIVGSGPRSPPTAAAAIRLQQYGHLPPNLRPTQAQLSIPHHPAIDVLPWPSVRDRLIHVLAQPPEYRPTGAQSPMALVDFVYDIEDPAEGVRISGNDPYDAQNWEVGEKVFKGWWWCFDREIVTRTNELRRARGAATLGFGTMGSVLGEASD